MYRLSSILVLACALCLPALSADAPGDFTSWVYAKLELPKGDGTIVKELQRIQDRAQTSRYSSDFKLKPADTQIMLLVYKINAGVNPASPVFADDPATMVYEDGEKTRVYPQRMDYDHLRAYLIQKCGDLNRSKDFDASRKCMNAMLVLEARISDDPIAGVSQLIERPEFKALAAHKAEPYKTFVGDFKALKTASDDYQVRWDAFLVAAEAIARNDRNAVEDASFDAAKQTLEKCWPVPPYDGQIHMLVRTVAEFQTMLVERKRPELAEKIAALIAAWTEKADETTRANLARIAKWEEAALAAGARPRHFKAKDDEEAKTWENERQATAQKRMAANLEAEKKKLNEEAAKKDALRLEAHASIGKNLDSTDGALRLKGIEDIDKMFVSKVRQDVDDACSLFSSEWYAKLIVKKQYDEFMRLSKAAILARPGNTATNAMLLFQRVKVLEKKGDIQGALSEVKAFYNLAGLDGFDEVEALAREILKSAMPKAGGDLSALRRVKAFAKEYDREIERAKMGSYDELLALGNLMLLVDSPREAHIVFQRAMLVAQPDKSAESLENVARAIKAEDVNTARATEWLKKAQAAAVAVPDAPPITKPKVNNDPF